MTKIRNLKEAREYIQKEWAEWYEDMWWVAREDEHTPASAKEAGFLNQAKAELDGRQEARE